LAEAQGGRGMAGATYGVAQSMAAEASRQAEQARKALGGLQPGATAMDRAKLEAAAEAAAKAEQTATERMIGANQERLAQEERIRDVRLQSADESIAKTQEEIAMRQSLIDREKQRLMSAQERIAGMNEGEKAQYAELIQRARAGGELTSEEFRQLKTVGLEETDRLSREYAEKMSRGFLQQTGMGKEEADRISRLEKEKKAMEVTLKDQRDLRVNIERDDNALVQRIAEQIQKQMEERDRKLEQTLAQELEKAKNQNARAAAARQTSVRTSST